MKTSNKIATISINDIKDRYFDGLSISEEERIAMDNYDHYRLSSLEAVKGKADFKSIYSNIQALANISSYRYFLNLSSLKAN